MAVNLNPLGGRVELKFNTGNVSNGKAVYKTRSLTDISPEAANEDLMAVAEELGGLLTYTLTSVTRVDENELENA